MLLYCDESCDSIVRAGAATGGCIPYGGGCIPRLPGGVRAGGGGFLWPACGRNHQSAERSADLNGGKPAGARPAMDEQRFARRNPGPPCER